MPRKAAPKVTYRFTETDEVVLRHTVDDIGLFAQHYFNVEPMPWQRFFYHAPQKNKMVVAGIRSGKTFGASISFLHYALFHPWCRIANASISLDQAKIVYYNALQLAEMPRFQKFVKEARTHPYPEIVLINGAVMWFRTIGYEAELWRGQEFDWINVDEAAYVSNANAIATLRGRLLGRNPMTGLYRDGIFSITTSPRGRGWLYDLWRKGDPAFADEYEPAKYLSLRVRTIDNPHISPEILADLMADYTERQKQQELEGAFLDPEDAVFSWESIQYMSDERRPEVRELLKRIDALGEAPDGDGVIPKVLDKHDYERYQLPPGKNNRYIITWDLGTKATRHVGRNATVGFVLNINKRPWEIVGYRRERQASYPMIIQWIKEWEGYYKNGGRNAVETVIDATGSGGVIQQILEEEHHLGVEGIIYSTTSKPDVINAGQVCLDRGWVVGPPIRAVMDEFSSYEMVDKKIAQDTVMALCQGLRRARELAGDYDRGLTGQTLPTRTGQRQIDPYERFRRRRLDRSQRTNWYR